MRNFSSILISISLIFYFLYIGKSFFIPFSIAIVAWYLIIAITSAINSIKINKRSLGHSLSLFVAIIILFISFLLFMTLVNSNIGNVIRLAPTYQQKFRNITYEAMDLARIDKSLGINEVIQSIDMSNFLLKITEVFAVVASYTTMIIVFTIFLLLEYRMLGEKMRQLFESDDKYERFRETLASIDKEIKTYLKIKTLSSLATALLAYLVLSLVGVDLAVFWALLVFVLNYIPTIGSIVATSFPMIISLVQFPSFVPFIIVTCLLILIQVIVGNVIEPRFMGDSLNLSPLIILISLAIWGNMWGFVGMFLCIPIMSITNIILAKFDKTRPIAILLSATGKIK